MNAGEKQELRDNALLGWLTRTWESLRTGNPNTWLVGASVVVLVLAVVWTIWYAQKQTYLTTSSLWTQIDLQGDVSKLEEIAKREPTTMPGRIARFHLARIALDRDGLPKLAALKSADRAKAADAIDTARESYLKLSREVGFEPTLKRETLLQAGRAEEALIGVPSAKDANVTRGSIDKAIEYYTQLKNLAPESAQGKQAVERLKELTENRAGVEEFYKALAASFPKDAPEPPPITKSLLPPDDPTPTKTKPAETKPTETKSTVTKPAETKPTTPTPTTKPAETKPTTPTPTTKPAETKPEPKKP